MKRTVMMAVLIFAGIAAGCSRNEPAEPESKPSDSGLKADMKLAVEGFTGKAAVDAGKRAMNTIEDISEQKNKDLNEVMP